jgi:hypothetical protein
MFLPPLLPQATTLTIDPPGEVRPAERATRPDLPAGVTLPPLSSPPIARPPSPAIEAGALPSAAELTSAIEDIGLRGKVVETRTLDQRFYGSVRIEANTDVSLHLEGSTLIMSASPGLVLDLRFGPEVRIGVIRYDLGTCTFDVDAQGPGIDALYGGIANWVANNYLRELLPTELRQRGYEPRNDSAAEKGVAGLIAGLLTGKPGPAGILIRDIGGSAALRLPRDVGVDVGDDMRLEIPKGAQFTLDASFEGPPDSPVLRDITLRDLDRRGVTIRKRDGTFAPIEGIVVRSVSLRPNGQVLVDYDPIPEQLVNGGASLFRLMIAATGLASGDARGLSALDHVPNHRLDGLRATIDAQIREAAVPKLLGFIRGHDTAIDGVSLERLLAVPRP